MFYNRKKKKNTKVKPKIGKKTVHSDFEYKTYNYLIDVMPNHKVEYETVKLPYTVNHIYTPDFILTLPDGRQLIIETKGNGHQFDAAVRQKMIAVRDQHPELDIRLCFYTDGKIGPKRKDGSFRKQSDWAKDNNFQYCIKEIPLEWLN